MKNTSSGRCVSESAASQIAQAQSLPCIRLRVGHMIGSLRIGGAERQVVNLLNAYPPGQGAIIILNEQMGPLAADLHPDIARVQAGSVRWITLPLSIWRLVIKLKRLNLDVLQTHMFWANFVGSIAGRLAGIPAILTTEHGKNEHKPRWARWAERAAISKLSDARVCVSEDIRLLRNVKDSVPLDQLNVIANGTPVRQRKLQTDRVPVVIGSVGRLIEAKDYPTLISAAALLREKHCPFRLVIVGDGPVHEQLVTMVKEHQLEHLVELPGFSTDIQSWLDSFDIYAISSVREGQPLSLLEAMAVGLPIVATAVGGIPNTVEHDLDAVLVPAGDAPALAAALGNLITDFPLRERLGAAAHARMVSEFSVSASLGKHMALYLDVLRKGGNVDE